MKNNSNLQDVKDQTRTYIYIGVGGEKRERNIEMYLKVLRLMREMEREKVSGLNTVCINK